MFKVYSLRSAYIHWSMLVHNHKRGSEEAASQVLLGVLSPRPSENPYNRLLGLQAFISAVHHLRGVVVWT